VQHAVRRRLGRESVVVAGHDDVEVRRREVAEASQGTLDRGPPVACQHADLEPLGAQPSHELFGAFVGRRGVGGGELERLEGPGGRSAFLALRQRQDPLEHELVRRAADGTFHGAEVERAGVGQGAVEVEEHGTQPERRHVRHSRLALVAVAHQNLIGGRPAPPSTRKP